MLCWARRAYQVMLTFHGHLITPHLFWVHNCLSERSLFCFCVHQLYDYPERFRYVDLRLTIGYLSTTGVIVQLGSETSLNVLSYFHISEQVLTLCRLQSSKNKLFYPSTQF